MEHFLTFYDVVMLGRSAEITHVPEFPWFDRQASISGA